jgi:hypothetical protein
MLDKTEIPLPMTFHSLAVHLAAGVSGPGAAAVGTAGGAAPG